MGGEGPGKRAKSSQVSGGGQGLPAPLRRPPLAHPPPSVGARWPAAMEVPLLGKHPRLFTSLSLSIHALGAAHFWFGAYYDWVYVDVPTEVAPIYAAFGYKLKFLTYWDALLQAFFFTVCLVSDVLAPRITETPSKPARIVLRFKEFLQASIAFPIALFVGSTFWGLMAVDRELVLPKVLDDYFPSWLNHVMHTNIVVFQLADMLTSSRKYPPRKWALLGLFLFQSAYLGWMHIVFYKSGLWVYPVLDALPPLGRVVFFAGSFAGGFAFYFVGEYLNKFLWGKSEHVD